MKDPSSLELRRLHFEASSRGNNALGAFKKYKEALERRRRLQEHEKELDAEVFAARRELDFQIARSPQ